MRHHIKYLLFLINIGLSNRIVAQINLVPNSSFEVYDSCPDFDGQINRAIPLFQPYTLGSSTDYFNSCTLDTIVDVPFNNIECCVFINLPSAAYNSITAIPSSGDSIRSVNEPRCGLG